MNRPSSSHIPFGNTGGKYQRLSDANDEESLYPSGDTNGHISSADRGDSRLENAQEGDLARLKSRDSDMESSLRNSHGSLSRLQSNGQNGQPRDWKQHSNDILSAPEATAGLEGYIGDSVKIGNAAFMRKALINGTLIGLWYLFSVSISVYNTWMFADKQLNFHFPLFTTSLHMVVQFCLASLVLLFIPRFRPRRDSINPHSSGGPVEPVDPSKPLMTAKFYGTRIAPCATATGLDIGLGNTSLRFVTLTFFTMCKSSTLGFVLAFAIIFRLEKMSWKLAGIIAVMTLGVIMMVAGETAFSTIGFVLLMMASFFSGLRWSLTQILLRRHPATSNPFATLFFLTPVMFVVILLVALPVERVGPLIEGVKSLCERKGVGTSLFILITPGILAFLMTSSEFALLKRTSVVTLSICGIFKEVLTIAAGGLFFDDKLTPINISGLMVTIVAIAAYNYIRITKMKRKAVEQAQESMEMEENAPMLQAQPSIGQAGHGEQASANSTTGMISDGLQIPIDADEVSSPKSLSKSIP